MKLKEVFLKTVEMMIDVFYYRPKRFLVNLLCDLSIKELSRLLGIVIGMLAIAVTMFLITEAEIIAPEIIFVFSVGTGSTISIIKYKKIPYLIIGLATIVGFCWIFIKRLGTEAEIITVAICIAGALITLLIYFFRGANHNDDGIVLVSKIGYWLVAIIVSIFAFAIYIFAP